MSAYLHFLMELHLENPAEDINARGTLSLSNTENVLDP